MDIEYHFFLERLILERAILRTAGQRLAIVLGCANKGEVARRGVTVLRDALPYAHRFQLSAVQPPAYLGGRTRAPRHAAQLGADAG